jgi:hypothetical protein
MERTPHRLVEVSEFEVPNDRREKHLRLKTTSSLARLSRKLRSRFSDCTDAALNKKTRRRCRRLDFVFVAIQPG